MTGGGQMDGRPGLEQPLQRQYPTNHPLGNSKHLCSICGDRATGKHYGVFSCEGCKGFFKRTIRKDIVYVCRAQGVCLIDMRQRNRCQYCRYKKCLERGMKREAVQEEKQRLKMRALQLGAGLAPVGRQFARAESTTAPAPAISTSRGGSSSSSSNNSEPADQQEASAHLRPIEPLTLKWAAQVQVERLLDWARAVPKFGSLLLDDQVSLLRASWNELIIADLAYRTLECLREGSLPGGADGHWQRRASSASSSPTPGPSSGALCIGRGLFVDQQQAHQLGLGSMFERILQELVLKMAAMRVDANELACLRAIVLFNPETQGLKSAAPIEETRGHIYTTLELYCREHHETQPNRFGKLLLRLPVLRSMGLKCDSLRRACDSRRPTATLAEPLQPFAELASPGGASCNSQHSAVSSSSGSTNSSGSCNNSTNASTNGNMNAGQLVSTTSEQPAAGQPNQLLFFHLCYESACVDQFLRASLARH